MTHAVQKRFILEGVQKRFMLEGVLLPESLSIIPDLFAFQESLTTFLTRGRKKTLLTRDRKNISKPIFLCLLMGSGGSSTNATTVTTDLVCEIPFEKDLESRCRASCSTPVRPVPSGSLKRSSQPLLLGDEDFAKCVTRCQGGKNKAQKDLYLETTTN